MKTAYVLFFLEPVTEKSPTARQNIENTLNHVATKTGLKYSHVVVILLRKFSLSTYINGSLEGVFYCFNFDILLETIMDIILSSSYHWLGRTLRMVCMEILQEKASKGHERQERKN